MFNYKPFSKNQSKGKTEQINVSLYRIRLSQILS